MIRFEDVTITYPGATRPALAGVDLDVPEGELCLVVGRTGSGKSTLLGAVNGLVPHFTGGHLSGRVTVDGRDTRTHPPRELADVVGVVGQDPLAGFVTDTVEEELAAVTRLVHDLGVTVLMAEHRLERVVQYADRVLHLAGDGSVAGGDPATVLETSSVAPPVVEL